jgi:pimeloyl-ACP methyl ester carboxylesterase
MRSIRPGSILTAIILIAACGDRAADPPAAATAEPAAPETRVWTTEDGNRMPYEVTGKGDVTVLLVHCWMCARSFWDAQVPVLAERYRTIALDLPGHGEASDDRTGWSVAAYGDDLAGFIEDLDLHNVILVGHSMGGPVSLRAAALTGDRVRGIVAVDTLHDAEFVFPEEQMDAFVAAFEADFPATCDEFVKQMFPEDNAEAAMTYVQETSCGAERAPIGVALMKDFGTIDMSAWFREAGVPIRAINAAQPNPTRVDTNRKYADFDAVLMEGVGHYPHMSRPEEFNPLLLEAIAELTEDSA